MRALRKDGTLGNVDVLDLDDASFRAFVLEQLVQARLVGGVVPKFIEGEHVELKERTS